jgi:hypothetical protein
MPPAKRAREATKPTATEAAETDVVDEAVAATKAVTTRPESRLRTPAATYEGAETGIGDLQLSLASREGSGCHVPSSRT